MNRIARGNGVALERGVKITCSVPGIDDRVDREEFRSLLYHDLGGHRGDIVLGFSRFDRVDAGAHSRRRDRCGFAHPLQLGRRLRYAHIEHEKSGVDELHIVEFRPQAVQQLGVERTAIAHFDAARLHTDPASRMTARSQQFGKLARHRVDADPIKQHEILDVAVQHHT